VIVNEFKRSDGLEVDDEDLDRLRQKPSNGPEAMLGISRPWKLGTRRGGSATVILNAKR